MPHNMQAALVYERLSAHPRLTDSLALLAGAASVLAFAPFEWRPFAVLAPAVLFVLVLSGTPARAFVRAYLFGLAQFGFGVSWFYNSIHDYGHAPVALAVGFTFCLVLVLALFPGLVAWLSRRYFRVGVVAQLVIVLPALWVMMEWVRSWLFTGFPWLLLGHTQVDTPLAGLVPVFGVFGASWFVVLSAGLLVALFTVGLRRCWLALPVLVVLWGAGWSLQHVEWTQPAGDEIRASLVQANIDQDLKWRPEQFRVTLALYRDLTRSSWGSDLIIWPETSIPAYFHQIEEHWLSPLAAEAAEQGAQLLLGVLYQDAEQRRYNSLVHAGGTAVYHKRHLVPFGEFMPFRWLLQWVDGMVDIPVADIQSGTGRPLMMLGDLALGVSICYEDVFGNETLDALPEARLLVNVSNDAWFGDSLAPPQHMEIARTRALETGRPLLRATNTGVSAAIDHKGNVLAALPQFRTQVLTTHVTPYQGLTPFARWGNWAAVLFLLSLLLAALWKGHKQPVERASCDTILPKT